MSKDNYSSDGLPIEEVHCSERLSTLFRKYRIEQYFWRNYKNTARIKSLVAILVVATVSIVFTILICQAMSR